MYVRTYIENEQNLMNILDQLTDGELTRDQLLKGGGEDVVADSTTPEKLSTSKLPTKPAPTKPADKVPIKKSLKAKKVSAAKARANDLFKHPRYSETTSSSDKNLIQTLKRQLDELKETVATQQSRGTV